MPVQRQRGLSLSEAGPGRFGRQACNGIHHRHLPYHTIITSKRAVQDEIEEDKQCQQNEMKGSSAYNYTQVD